MLCCIFVHTSAIWDCFWADGGKNDDDFTRYMRMQTCQTTVYASFVFFPVRVVAWSSSDMFDLVSTVLYSLARPEGTVFRYGRWSAVGRG